ncbi:large ribosomal subunit protein uL14m isoform X1 [Pungitius pungitius]|uniref:large ribosomal subunit protein uL14m isoform X1 n=2 Tax=Pungitius pungitius TaxID=134920 RepID=UPI002E1084EE
MYKRLHSTTFIKSIYDLSIFRKEYLFLICESILCLSGSSAKKGTFLAVIMALQLLSRSLTGLIVESSSMIQQKTFSVSAVAAAIQKLTRVRVVDNSSLGNTPYHRSPRVIHVYTKNGVGKVGDKVLLAIKGQKKKALIVGHKMPGERMSPRFDSNNVVLIEENGNPTGTRIKVPLPTLLRKVEGDYSKVLAIASSFV